MGVVYLARHAKLGKQVAVKILSGHYRVRANAARDMLREAQAASRLHHPHIININDFGTTDDGAAYIVMEYLVGEDLRSLIGRLGRIPFTRASRILRQIASALGAAHRAGIVHRDLKPENIFLLRDDSPGEAVEDHDADDEDFVKVLDFGLAKVLDMEPSARTREGVIAGTPHYMSPEHVRNANIDGRSDIYSLGVLFYQMVTGRLPFKGGSVAEVLMGHVSLPTVPPIRLVPTLEEGGNRVILRCLEKNPEERYQTMEGLVEALRRVTPRPDVTGPHRLEEAAPELGETRDVSGSAQLASSVSRRSGVSSRIRGTRQDGSAEFLDRPAAEGSVSEVVGESVSGSAIFPSPWRRRRTVLWASGAAALVALTVTGAFLSRDPGRDAGRPASTVVGAVAPRPAVSPGLPDRVTIAVEGVPLAARVYLDDVLVPDRPLLLRGTTHSHRLRVEATGFVTATQAFIADRDQRLRFTLQAVSPASAPVAVVPGVPVNGKAKKGPRVKGPRVVAKKTGVKPSPVAAVPPKPPVPTPKTKKYRDWVMDMDP
jgi:serine/threonine protein kinase